MLSSDQMDTIRSNLDNLETRYGVRITFEFIEELKSYRLYVRKDNAGCARHFSYEELVFTRIGALETIRLSALRMIDDAIKAAKIPDYYGMSENL
jgi:hypothetical protein